MPKLIPIGERSTQLHLAYIAVTWLPELNNKILPMCSQVQIYPLRWSQRFHHCIFMKGRQIESREIRLHACAGLWKQQHKPTQSHIQQFITMVSCTQHLLYARYGNLPAIYIRCQKAPMSCPEIPRDVPLSMLCKPNFPGPLFPERTTIINFPDRHSTAHQRQV